MTEYKTRMIRLPDDFESQEAALFFAQLEDLSRRLWEGVEDATPEDLEWQPAPGMNTQGMLLAHIAITEVFWLTVLGETAFVCQQVLGIGVDDDGMPQPPDGRPPERLAGQGLPFYRELLMKAREHTRGLLAPLRDADVTRPIEHRRRDAVITLDARWILYHVVEHLSGHFGQILMLRHMHGLSRAERAAEA